MDNKPRYRYEIDDVEDWARLIDTKTGKMIEGHRIYVEDAFFLLGISDQLEIVSITGEEEEV